MRRIFVLDVETEAGADGIARVDVNLRLAFDEKGGKLEMTNQRAEAVKITAGSSCDGDLATHVILKPLSPERAGVAWFIEPKVKPPRPPVKWVECRLDEYVKRAFGGGAEITVLASGCECGRHGPGHYDMPEKRLKELGVQPGDRFWIQVNQEPGDFEEAGEIVTNKEHSRRTGWIPVHKPKVGGGGCAEDCAAEPPHKEKT